MGDGESDEDDERLDSVDDKVRQKEMRRGIDLATTLERIEKNFVITDPRLLDNPIIFASDNFLELTEYSREEILGRNCSFLEGPETNPETVRKIRQAIDNQTDVTVQLINYTKSEARGLMDQSFEDSISEASQEGQPIMESYSKGYGKLCVGYCTRFPSVGPNQPMKLVLHYATFTPTITIRPQDDAVGSSITPQVHSKGYKIVQGFHYFDAMTM
ncbi:hypothetical protein IFM89_002005 [Coptis chinensis]|uniref:PAS domain-containing protein n=1 Tax=Coptis chinensis TaxID=261450 RepID=A0A835HIL5_9MAGN|nr:hypothetical protein IFM89_002005 [Coptis chinensis]